MHFLSNSPKKSWGLTKMHYLCSPKWCHGRVVRQRSAKPSTAVRFCLAPLETPLRVSQGRLTYPIFLQGYYNIATLSFQKHLPIATSVRTNTLDNTFDLKDFQMLLLCKPLHNKWFTHISSMALSEYAGQFSL